MNRIILITIMILIISTISYAKVSLPKYKLIQDDYHTLSTLNENTEVEVRLVCSDDIQKCEEELQQLGVKVVKTEGDKIIIRTSVGQLNKIASSDWIVLIEKEGKTPKTKAARTLSKPDIPSIIQAEVVCDNPPVDYQTQIQNLGPKIIKIEGNILGIEVAGYEILNKIGHLNYVMRIDNITEVPTYDINTKEGK